jgi:holo-[acyl-carrier protein] synthase
MILGTGIDMIEVERVEARAGRDTGFRELVFSKREIAYCESRASPFQHFAARFAAKEAFLKAIGRGWDSGLALNEIEIVNEENGKPMLRLTGSTEAALASLGIRSIHVSLSHLAACATAIVILES